MLLPFSKTTGKGGTTTADSLVDFDIGGVRIIGNQPGV
jgi:hypothetical protein